MTDPWQTQMLKGLVEMSVLAVLASREAYGYEILQILDRYPGLSLKESSLYLLLTRLRKQGLLTERQVASESGPARRYFRLSADGKERLKQMLVQWKSLRSDLDTVLEEVGYS